MKRHNVKNLGDGNGSVFERYRSGRNEGWYISYMAPGEDGPEEQVERARLENEEPAQTEAQAIRCLMAVREKLTADKLGVQKYTGRRGQTITVNELCDAVEAHYRAHTLAAGPAMKAHLWHIRKAFGLRLARSIKLKDLNTFIGDQKEAWNKKRNRKGFSESSIRQRLMYLSQGYTLMKDEIPYHPPIPNIKPNNVRKGFVEPAECAGLLAELAVHYRDFCEWAWWTGWRRGAISGLEWSALSRGGPVWTMTLPKELAKNDEAQTIPVEGPLRALIERRIAERRPGVKYIFHREGNKIYNFTDAWKAAVARAVEKGVLPEEKAGLLVHDFRRSAARNMIIRGVDRSVAKKVTGHKTDSMFDRYNIVTTDQVGDGLRKTFAGIGGVR